MLVIGLTGGIGTGKTEISRVLEDLGAAVVSADLIGHEVYQPHTEGWREVVKAFGEGVLAPNREVDRDKLGAIVFRDRAALERLNAITHPRIYEIVEQRLSLLRNEGREVAVVEAALLVEANWAPLLDEIWVTVATEAEVIRRIQDRNHANVDAIRARIRSQLPLHERVRHADAVIDNSGSLADLTAKVQELWEKRVSACQEIEPQK